MREIIFRGKRISNGEWVHGGIVKTFHPNFPVESEIAFFAQRPNAYAICVNNKDCFVGQGTIGQFTGMKDKRGSKIYEGDIVFDDRYSCNMQVIYSEETAQFLLYREDTTYGELSSWCVIVGNIYDTPEKINE